MSFTRSYNENEPNFPQQNNLILQKKVAGVDKVVNFKAFSRPIKEIKYFSRNLTEFKDFLRRLTKFQDLFKIVRTMCKEWVSNQYWVSTRMLNLNAERSLPFSTNLQIEF